jgi:hypothetical protein
MRKAISLYFQKYWHDLEQLRDDRTGYYDSDGGWRLSWIYLDSDIKQIVKRANLQQVELEMQQPESRTQAIIPTTKIQTKMNKENQTTQQIKMENWNVFMGDSYGGIFPLPGAQVTVHQHAAANGKPAQTTQGPIETQDDRQERKQRAINDMCSRIDNLKEDMIGYDNDGNKLKYAMLSAFLRKALGVLEGRPDSQYQAIQEGIWCILIDKREKCIKDPKEQFFSQTFLNIIGYLIKHSIINGKKQDILNCLYAKPEESMRKCLERGIVSAFPAGTEDMLDFYIDQLKEGRLL